jgi:hypothetical protein
MNELKRKQQQPADDLIFRIASEVGVSKEFAEESFIRYASVSTFRKWLTEEKNALNPPPVPSKMRRVRLNDATIIPFQSRGEDQVREAFANAFDDE